MIPIGGQPASMAELVADLERRQTTQEDFGDASSASSASSQPNAAKSVGSSQSSVAGQTSRPAVGQPVQTSALPGQATQSVQPSPPAATTTTAPAAAPPATSSAPPVAALPSPSPSSQPATTPANGQVQNPAAPSSSLVPALSSAPTTLLTLTRPSSGTPLPDLLSPSTVPGSVATIPANVIPAPPAESSAGLVNNTLSDNLDIAATPQNDTGMAVGIILGSIIATAIVGAFLVFCCVRKKRLRRQDEDEARLFQQQGAADGLAPAARPPAKKKSWESKLYGSTANRSTTGGASFVGGGVRVTARSIFVAITPPWMSGARDGQQRLSGGEPALQAPPRIGPAANRYSKRSTGLTTLDEKQFKTYQNLVGRSNPKAPVAFDNPFFQRDSWR